MKKFVLILLFISMSFYECLAWARYGHEIAIAVAQRYLTEKTKENLAKYFPYDLKEDCVWMDEHRNDEEIAFTTFWHAANYTDDYKYDPHYGKTLGRGDAVTALHVVDDNFRDGGYKDMSDSLVVFNVRMLIHFLPDAHCPVHCGYGYPAKKRKGPRYIAGVRYPSYHTFYDMIPVYIWGDVPADEVAAMIDDASRRERRKIVDGHMIDWFEEVARVNHQVYEWNKFDQKVMRDDTIEISKDLVAMQLRNAGYRLAYLLNLYFGE